MYASGLIRSSPLLRPLVCNSRSVRPSKLPPTRPSFARNSSITLAFHPIVCLLPERSDATQVLPRSIPEGHRTMPMVWTAGSPADGTAMTRADLPAPMSSARRSTSGSERALEGDDEAVGGVRVGHRVHRHAGVARLLGGDRTDADDLRLAGDAGTAERSTEAADR